jgi:CheY-like chemotaxis protein
MLFDKFVLVAEDDEDQVHFYERTFKKIELRHYYIARDGEETVEYLRGRGRFEDRVTFPFPDWLLLDVKMPRMNGLEVLEFLQKNPQCNVVPSIMFSGASQPADVKRAYELGVNAFFVKPSTIQELADDLAIIKNFWDRAMSPIVDPSYKC